MKSISLFAVVLALAGLLNGCARATPMPQGGTRGPVYVDETDLLLMESHPVQVALVVRGHLPTPCHEVRWEVSGPDEDGRVDVTLYSLAPEGKACIQVLEAFEERVPLGSFAEGSFSVWLNGERVQAFELP